MHKRIICMLIAALLSLVACSQQSLERRGERHQEMDRSHNSLYQDQTSQTNYGYKKRPVDFTRSDRDQTNGQNEIGFFHADRVNYPNQAQQPNVFIDRSILAKHISQMLISLPQVKASTVLVTDDHVFLGVQQRPAPKGSKPMTGKQLDYEAKRVAQSVTPRFFKVHVTHRADLEREINQIGMRMQKNGDIEGTNGNLNDLLRRMGDETPPG